jgi:hypothetical protein
MRPLTCLFSSALLILISCTDKVDKSEEKLFTPANILVQQFSIDPAEDTTLIGLRGGIFKISKGSFEGNSPINIEIKEVYSPLENNVCRIGNRIEWPLAGKWRNGIPECV